MDKDMVSETVTCRRKGNNITRALWLVTGLVCVVLGSIGILLRAREVTTDSDREVAGGIKNCVLLKRMREIVKRTGLEIDPKFICERDAKYFPKLFKEFGMDVAWTLEENGCKFSAKLK
jgi:hypothetical protein